MFNLSQKKAIDKIDGPVLVLAGPGSGKTFTMVNRIDNMITNHQIDPDSILVITFTHKSSVEMKERYMKLVEKKDLNGMPKFGTFHSIFYEILRESFGYNEKSLMDKKDKYRLLSEVLENYSDIKIDENIINNTLKDIEDEKLCNEKGEKFKPKFTSEKLFKRIKNDYKNKLIDEKKLDFYDMIERCYEMLNDHKDVLSYYQDKYKYILIDEFQDINKNQYDIVKLICKSKNIFVVGDDDQSIYMFRGSKPSIIKDFKKDFFGTSVIKLNENYRSAKSIVRFSKKVIDKNRKRVKKELKSERDERGHINIKAFDNGALENDFIIRHIKEKLNKGYKLSDIAILYRTNLLSKSIVDNLKSYNIPFEIKDDNNSFYEMSEIKDILSYLYIVSGSKDSKYFVNIINKPLRYISRNAISYKKTRIEEIRDYYFNKKYVLKYIDRFDNDIRKIKKFPTALAIKYIRNEMGYDKYLYDEAKKLGKDINESILALDELEDMSVEYPSIKEFLLFVESDKKDNKKEDVNKDTDRIKLMTFHSSKGLEFKEVIIIDANDGLIPHRKSVTDMDIETERRLFYVACTRAKDDLNIYFTKERFGKSFEPSRFIKEGIGI